MTEGLSTVLLSFIKGPPLAKHLLFLPDGHVKYIAWNSAIRCVELALVVSAVGEVNKAILPQEGRI